MAPTFKRKIVFLDTEAFVRECFNFESTKLAEILRLASEGAIQVVTTTVTVKESKRRIDKMVRAAKNALKDKDLRFTLGILQQTSLDCSFFGTIDAKAFGAEVETKYDNYLSVCKAVICDASDISAESILDAYFAGSPPFGPEQKKDQFPDAVAIAALAKWQANDKSPVYVVSHDPDFIAACKGNPNLIPLKTITEFLDLHNKDAEEQAKFVHEQIEQSRERISQEIKKQFMNLGFVLDGEDGDVEHVTVDNVELGDTSFVALHEDHAVVEVETTVVFTADITYDDTSTGYYDSEDGCLWGMEQINKTVKRTKDLTVELELVWDGDHLGSLSVSLGITDVEIDVGIDDGWYD